MTALAAPSAYAQDDPQSTQQRITNLERRVDQLADEQERSIFADIFVPVGESQYGFGPAASKVYSVQPQSLSIGGYAEMVYNNYSSTTDAGLPSGMTDELDFLRAILYFGFKFDENWLFNSEFEFEHASTGANGSASVEFAYVDYLHSEEINFRGGLLLIPMGFINELHEPTTFYSANRPITETIIMPSTWRENGLGIFGDVCDFSYRAYIVNSLEGANFRANGLRGGRQRGSEALAENFSVVVRVDWNGVEGLTLGGSAYMGNQGQGIMDASGTIDLSTSIYELHAQFEHEGLRVRALGAWAEIDDVAQLNNFLSLTGSQSIGEELDGHYIEVGYDILTWLAPNSDSALIPFVRYEGWNTQAKVPAGFAADPATDGEAMTYGLAYYPISQVVLKVDVQDFDNGAGSAVDQINAALGLIF